MISVIIPVYNVERYIGACVQSLLNQVYREFDIIIVNDGSFDRSAEIAESLLSAQREIPYQIISTGNRGVSAARNTGINRARGKYVVMVDADDVLSPFFLFNFYEQSQEFPNTNIYSCGFSVMNEKYSGEFSEKKEKDERLSFQEAQMAFFERRIKFLLPALMIRVSFINSNGIRFDEAVRYSEDVQFIWRCLAYNRETVVHTGTRYYNYILHSGSTMTASGVEKILSFCDGLDRLYKETENLFCEPVKSQLRTRMYFSMIHGAAKMLLYKDFNDLYSRSNCKKYICRQITEGGIKPRVAALSLIMSRRLGYKIMRRF